MEISNSNLKELKEEIESLRLEKSDGLWWNGVTVGWEMARKELDKKIDRLLTTLKKDI